MIIRRCLGYGTLFERKLVFLDLENMLKATTNFKIHLILLKFWLTTIKNRTRVGSMCTYGEVVFMY